MRSGAPRRSIARIWTVEVCERSAKPFGRVKSVLRFTRRMTFGNIQRVKIVIIGFNLAVVLNRITHRNENVFDLLAQKRQNMQMTFARARSGKVTSNLSRSIFCVADKFLRFVFGFFDAHSQFLFQLTARIARTRRVLRARLVRSTFSRWQFPIFCPYVWFSVRPIHAIYFPRRSR